MNDEVVLRQNLPTKVGGARLIAFNIRAGEAVLSVDNERTMVAPDSLVEVGGTTYRIADLVPDSPERAERRPNGWLTLRREAGA